MAKGTSGIWTSFVSSKEKGSDEEREIEAPILVGTEMGRVGTRGQETARTCEWMGKTVTLLDALESLVSAEWTASMCVGVYFDSTVAGTEIVTAAGRRLSSSTDIGGTVV